MRGKIIDKKALGKSIKHSTKAKGIGIILYLNAIKSELMARWLEALTLHEGHRKTQNVPGAILGSLPHELTVEKYNQDGPERSTGSGT